MLFEYDLVIPADTPVTAPVKLEMPLARGIIHKHEFQFPFGCNGLVHVVVNRALHQVWPTNPDGNLKGSGFPIEGPVWYELEEAPYKLEAYGWSTDDTFAHTITLRFWLQKREVLQPARAEMSLLGKLGELVFGRK